MNLLLWPKMKQLLTIKKESLMSMEQYNIYVGR